MSAPLTYEEKMTVGHAYWMGQLALKKSELDDLRRHLHMLAEEVRALEIVLKVNEKQK